MKTSLKAAALLLAVCLIMTACGAPQEAPAQPSAPAAQPQTGQESKDKQEPAPAAQDQGQTKTEEPAPTEKEPEYLYNDPAVPLEGELGELETFIAEYRGAVDGVPGEWRYELNYLKDTYGPGEHMIYMDCRITPEGGETVYRYYDMDEDDLKALAEAVEEAGFNGLNGYHVEEKDEAEDADRIVINAHYGSGEDLYLEAAGDHMPEGFDEAWQSFAMAINSRAGYATRGFTAFVPNAEGQVCQDMSNAVAFASCAQSDEYDLFAPAYSGDLPSLVKDPWHYSGYEFIEKGFWPHGVQYDRAGRALYYMAYDDEAQQMGLYRKSEEDDEPQLMVSDVSEYAAAGGMLYYREYMAEAVMAMDPETLETEMVVDKPVHSVYPVSGWLVYVDDEDDSIRAMDLEDGDEIVLVESSCGYPAVDGNSLYYLDYSLGCICRLDLVTGETEEYEDIKTGYEYFITPSYLYYYDSANGDAPTCVSREWLTGNYDPEDFFAPPRVFRAEDESDDITFIFAADMEVVYHVSDPDGNISYFCRMLNYFDGESSRWLDPDDPDAVW
ncbi:MAG: DUF5050 domain-containing protein [Firmicutes bacterium]|nr:DUF5050 domain-containing protein [Bacillota bacterium]